MAEECGDGLLVSRGVDVCQGLGRWKCQGQDTDTTFTVAGSVKDSRLHADDRLCNRLINSHLDHVGLVTGEGRESTEIRTTVEEVAVEGVHTQTGGCAHTENGLQTNLRREIVRELTGELHSIFGPCGIPPGVEVGLTTGVAGQAAQRCHILVLRGEEEHIHRDLSF